MSASRSPSRFSVKSRSDCQEHSMTSSWQKACICRRKWTISDWTMREWCQSLCRSSCTIRFSRVEMGSADLSGVARIAVSQTSLSSTLASKPSRPSSSAKDDGTADHNPPSPFRPVPRSMGLRPCTPARSSPTRSRHVSIRALERQVGGGCRESHIERLKHGSLTPGRK